MNSIINNETTVNAVVSIVISKPVKLSLSNKEDSINLVSKFKEQYRNKYLNIVKNWDVDDIAIILE